MKYLSHVLKPSQGRVILVSTPKRMGSSGMTDYLLSKWQPESRSTTSTSMTTEMSPYHVLIDEAYQNSVNFLTIQTKLGTYTTRSLILEGLRSPICISLALSTVLKWSQDLSTISTPVTLSMLALKESVLKKTMP